MRASLSGLVFFFRSSFSFSVLLFLFPFFLLLVFSFCSWWLGHRQISPSLSSLHVRTLLSRIAPCLCIMFCTRLQTPAVCPIQDKCGCSPCGVFSFFVNYVGIQFRHTAKGSRHAPLPSWLFSARWCPAELVFLHALILLHGLRGDSSRRLRAVAYLRVGGRCAYRPPSLAARHSHAHCHANQHG